jgi:hypothetical protein
MVPDATVAQISVKIQQAKESEVCGVKVCFSFVTHRTNRFQDQMTLCLLPAFCAVLIS